MTFNRNQKYMIFLLAFMALGISSFSTGSAHRAGHADFASEVIASPDQDEVNDFTQQVESNTFQNPATLAEGDDISVQASDVRQAQDGVKVKLAVHMTDDDGNESTAIEKDVFAQNTKELKKILPKRIKAIQKQALAKAKKEKAKKAKENKLAEDVKNCKVKVDDEGKRHAINENNVREKLKCFAEQEGNIANADDLQDYKDSVVGQYINSRMDIAKQMIAQNGTGGMMAARAYIHQLSAAVSNSGLQDTAISNQFQYADNVLNAHLTNFSQMAQITPIQRAQILSQYQPALSNPKTRVQAQKQFAAALQRQQTYNMVSAEATMLNSLGSMPPSMDPQWDRFGSMTSNQLIQRIRSQVNVDKDLSAQFGSFLAPYNASGYLDGNGSVNASMFAVNSQNPFNTNNIFAPSVTGLDALGLSGSSAFMTDTGGLPAWNPSLTGSAMANPSLTTPAIPQPPVTAMSLTGKKVVVNR